MDFLELGKKAAKDAGKIIREHIDESYKIDKKKSEYDLVTEWDEKVETFITDRILEYYPDHKVIGEESVHKESKSSFLATLKNEKNVWVIDPIDGTNNFIHNLPGYTVSIAMMSYGEIVVGIVYDPDNNEMFWAKKGKGAYLNGKKIKVSNEDNLKHSMIAVGFPSDVERYRKEIIKHINEIGLICRNLRIYGSAALHCAYVAAGRLEVFFEPGLNIWDIAAGFLIVKEAGGVVSELDGSSFEIDFESFICGNGKLNEDIINRINVD